MALIFNLTRREYVMIGVASYVFVVGEVDDPVRLDVGPLVQSCWKHVT